MYRATCPECKSTSTVEDINADGIKIWGCSCGHEWADDPAYPLPQTAPPSGQKVFHIEDFVKRELWPEHWNVLHPNNYDATTLRVLGRQPNSFLAEANPLGGWISSKIGGKYSWEKERDKTEKFPRVVRVYTYDDQGEHNTGPYGYSPSRPEGRIQRREDVTVDHFFDISMFCVHVLTDPKTKAYIGHFVDWRPPLPTVRYERKTVICQTCNQPQIAAIHPWAFRSHSKFRYNWEMDRSWIWLGAHSNCQDFPALRGDDANHGPWVDQFIDVRYLDVDSVEFRGEINPAYKTIVTDRRVEESPMFE